MPWPLPLWYDGRMDSSHRICNRSRNRHEDSPEVLTRTWGANECSSQRFPFSSQTILSTFLWSQLKMEGKKSLQFKIWGTFVPPFSFYFCLFLYITIFFCFLFCFCLSLILSFFLTLYRIFSYSLLFLTLLVWRERLSVSKSSFSFQLLVA